MINPKVILHATDFSKRSAYAFDLARSLACEESAELVVLHVLSNQGDSIARQKAERALAHLVKSEPTIDMRWTILAGDPADKILWMAKETRADLIVLAAGGRGRLRTCLFGSVSRDVERASPCPVVRLKLPDHWLSERTNEWKRCVYCNAPTVQSAG